MGDYFYSRSEAMNLGTDMKKGQFIEPTQAQLAISVGDRVVHKTHGHGLVIEKWGSFWACTQCFKTLESGNSKCHCGGRAHGIPGAGVCDVLFYKDGKTRSIHCTWIDPA